MAINKSLTEMSTADLIDMILESKGEDAFDSKLTIGLMANWKKDIMSTARYNAADDGLKNVRLHFTNAEAILTDTSIILQDDEHELIMWESSRETLAAILAEGDKIIKRKEFQENDPAPKILTTVLRAYYTKGTLPQIVLPQCW